MIKRFLNRLNHLFKRPENNKILVFSCFEFTDDPINLREENRAKFDSHEKENCFVKWQVRYCQVLFCSMG